jgi:DNA-binding CsgD family transcriptional regulator
MLRTILIYGAILALGALGIEWLKFQYFVRTNPKEIWIALFALAFLTFGIWVGARLFRRAPPAAFTINSQALTALGISGRELEVLELLAAGQSNKEIANRLQVSPNTIKTHVANLFDKLGVKRRTAAIQKARELGMIR